MWICFSDGISAPQTAPWQQLPAVNHINKNMERNHQTADRRHDNRGENIQNIRRNNDNLIQAVGNRETLADNDTQNTGILLKIKKTKQNEHHFVGKKSRSLSP